MQIPRIRSVSDPKMIVDAVCTVSDKCRPNLVRLQCQGWEEQALIREALIASLMELGSIPAIVSWIVDEKDSWDVSVSTTDLTRLVATPEIVSVVRFDLYPFGANLGTISPASAPSLRCLESSG